MAKTKKKNITKRVFGELSRRASSEASSRQDFVKSSIRTRIENLVPTNLRWLLPFIEDFKSGQVEDEEEATVETAIEVADSSRQVSQVVEPLYPEYRCIWGNPLTCDRLQQTVQQQVGAKYCRECGFPTTLPQKAEIRGNRGRYRVEGLLSRRGLGQLYQGIQLSDSQPVVIKEYLLPDRCFNQEEASTRKQAFELLAGVNLADGRVQDFRLCHPWEAIADANQERCYLVTKNNLDLYPTLSEYIALHGRMSAIAVRQVLNQVLQTLEFLHGQKFRLPSGQVLSGLAHGNLSLDSLLIARSQKSGGSQNGAFRNGLNGSAAGFGTLDAEFFIYVCDLALWERLFDPATSKILKPSPSQDLEDLGYVAFYLLAGAKVNPASNQPLDPQDDQHWSLVDFPLKAFILRLMGIDVPFESAQAARQALLRLPLETVTAPTAMQVVVEEEEKTKTPRILFLLLGILGLVLLGALIWALIPKSKDSESASDELPLCCIKDVSGVPSGKFTYTAEEKGIGSYVFRQKNLVVSNETLEQELTRRKPQLKLSYLPVPSGEAAIDKVRSEQADFAIASLASALTPDLEYKPVGYDGLAVFVAFSYSKREKSLPQALEGQISFENLRKLYTGQITNWRELGGPNLPVKLYLPDDPELVQIFEQRVLKDNHHINLFRSLRLKSDQPNAFVNSWVPVIYKLPTFDIFRSVIRDFENDSVGAIAFDAISKVFGQCSVYPLALVDGENSPVQALAQDNNQSIAPTTDLCNDKGSYHPDFQALKTGRYPLAYPLTIVYPRDNSHPPVGAKFADMLRTREGQQLLSKTGIVPLYPVSRK